MRDNFEEDENSDSSFLLWIVVISLVFMVIVLSLTDDNASERDKVEINDIKTELKNIKIDNDLFVSTYEKGEEDTDKHIIEFKNDKHVQIFCENLLSNIEDDYYDITEDKYQNMKGQIHHFDDLIYDDTNISENAKKAIQLSHEFALEVNEYLDIIIDKTSMDDFTPEDIEETYRKGVLSVRIADELVEDKDKPY